MSMEILSFLSTRLSRSICIDAESPLLLSSATVIARYLPPPRNDSGISNFPAAFGEEHRRVIAVAGKETRERKDGFVKRAVGLARRLHPVDRLAVHLIRPGALLAGRFVRTVEDQQQLVLGTLAQDRLIKVDG